MAATRRDISRWFDNGVEKGATHLIVVCDTYDWEDFPVYVHPGQNAREEATKHMGVNMEKVMEVYSLAMSKDSQMAEHRAFHYEQETA